MQKENEVYEIDKLLQKLWGALQPALQDIKATKPDGTPKASDAYTAFFTDKANIPSVGDLLTNITTGASALSGNFAYSVNGSPVFLSITERGEISANLDGEMTDMWDYYIKKPNSTASYLRHTPYIILFPYFWNSNPPNVYGDAPPAPVGDNSASNCLTVSKTFNRFQLNDALKFGGNLIQWRTWILMEELVHYYTNQARGTANDIQNANLLFGLPPWIQINTAQAYMYYAACIYGKCKDFPDRQRGIELLETDGSQGLPANETKGPPGFEVLDATDVQIHQESD
ncbi:MAG: hypothetical protein Q9225_007116 [Loekoesia sp. 1 TL-2023]